MPYANSFDESLLRFISIRRRIITCGSTSLFVIYDELALKEC